MATEWANAGYPDPLADAKREVVALKLLAAKLGTELEALTTECRRVINQRPPSGASQPWCAGCRRPDYGLGLSFLAAVERAERAMWQDMTKKDPK